MFFNINLCIFNLIIGVPLTWSNIDRLMEEQPELWTPELLQSLKGEWELEDRPKRDGENEEPRLQPEV